MRYYKINYSENLTNDECEDICSHFQDNFGFMSPAMEVYDISFKTWDPCRNEIESYCCLSRKTWKYYRKLINAIIWYVNELNDSTNLFISSERLFWAKIHELISRDVLPKSFKTHIKTGYANGKLSYELK